jgi:cystathionine gamma-synthase
VAAFAQDIARQHDDPPREAMLFPTKAVARRCVRFMKERAPSETLRHLEVVNLALDLASPLSRPLEPLGPAISAVLCLPAAFPYAKEYWQHTGDGISSRRAEFCHRLFRDKLLVPASSSQPSSPPRGLPSRGPRRYQRPVSHDGHPSTVPASQGVGHRSASASDETTRFIEERFGRNLDISQLGRAKSAIKRRIAGALVSDTDGTGCSSSPQDSSITDNTRGAAELAEGDIHLYPCGMNAIFNAHRYLLEARGSHKSINYGFPYVDTLKILQKFGPGCEFYGFASEQELDHLEHRLSAGERFLALFCEFPGNPLLTCPNLARIRQLADRYDFAVVVDETIGTFANINVLPFADIVVSSLTKIFSGDCNVMGGCAIINPSSQYYARLSTAAQTLGEDTYWAEDVIFMERNSRDFASRVGRINANAETICGVLSGSRLVKAVYYPKYGKDSSNYDRCKLPDAGYGGLLSVTFHREADAMVFYDAVKTAKGPSLGTNFTLASPYVLLAHYRELDWAKSLGVEPSLIRVSVGLEDTFELAAAFKEALSAAEASYSSR